ncbi:DUF3718 domain-containing protein [Aliikangiella marina]|uniref:DUF3718 domain-containing protein n=1 Tax=Aliikangiella marina TaxID=1712262 RepID=A0A545T4E1_9GAMM|nr:DUF3718 domain-containing protein [Aliikangiella marina]TQV72090.1 DUF3718 domain-containing protein [Aliikangiella marina]
MKLLKLSVLAVGLAGTSVAMAGSQQFIAGDKTKETAMCIAAASNNVQDYKSLVENYRTTSLVKVRDHQLFANKLTCNDVNIAKFARQYGAEKSAKFISKYLDQNILIRQDIANTQPINTSKTIVVSASMSAK